MMICVKQGMMTKLMEALLVAIVVLACLLDYFASAEQDAIQECESSKKSTSSDQKKYYCDAAPSYAIGDRADTTNGVITSAVGGYYTVATFDAKLTLTSVPSCPMTLQAPIQCTNLQIMLGSGAGQKDGVQQKIGGMGYDGQGQQGQSDFKPNDFQKFGEVTNDTDIYFVKTSDEGNTYFASDDTTLKFAAAQYESLTGAAAQSDWARNTNAVCSDGVQLCFTVDCEKVSEKEAGAAKLSLGALFPAIPLLVSRFF